MTIGMWVRLVPEGVGTREGERSQEEGFLMGNGSGRYWLHSAGESEQWLDGFIGRAERAEAPVRPRKSPVRLLEQQA